MAIRFLDSCAIYGAVTDLTLKWTTQTILSIQATGSRWSTPAIRTNGPSGGNGGYAEKTISSNEATLIAGANVKVATIGSQIVGIFTFLDGASGQVQVVITTAGLLAAYRITGNAAGTLLGTAAHTAIASGSDHYIEAKVTFHNTAGTVDLYLDGVNVLSLTGQDTNQTANAYANRFRIGNANNVQSLGGSTAINEDFSDIYLLDGNSPNNAAWGDTRIYSLRPSGAGATTQWDPSSGSNYACVDEATYDGDNDYVSTTVTNEIDTYAMQDIPATATVKGVQTVLVARKDDTGARQIAPVLRPASTDRVGTTQTLSIGYVAYLQQYDVSPETSSAFTASEVNGMEAGIKLIA